MLFPDLDSEAKYLSRTDVDEPLSSYAFSPFHLEGVEWPSVEHYFQAMKYDGVDEAYKEKVRLSDHPKQATKLGRTRRVKIRKDWKSVKRVMMTRAVYTKCKAHEPIAQALLSTGDAKIVANTQYDYYWGCGRDRRGENVYGQVLMDVRRKLKEEQSNNGAPA